MQLRLYPILEPYPSYGFDIARPRSECQPLEYMLNLQIRRRRDIGAFLCIDIQRDGSYHDCREKKKVALQHDVPPRLGNCDQYRQQWRNRLEKKAAEKL